MKRLGWPLTKTQQEVSEKLIKNGWKDEGKELSIVFKGITLKVKKEFLKKVKDIKIELTATSDYMDFQIVYKKWTTPDLLENFDDIKKNIIDDFSKFK